MSPLITGWWAPITVAACFALTIVFLRLLVKLSDRTERKENNGYTHQQLHDETCLAISEHRLDFSEYDNVRSLIQEGGRWAPSSGSRT